jgi:hypothetical protein
MRVGVDENVLRDSEDRYPNYLAMDMVDWREEHHGSHGHDGSTHREVAYRKNK